MEPVAEWLESIASGLKVECSIHHGLVVRESGLGQKVECFNSALSDG